MLPRPAPAAIGPESARSRGELRFVSRATADVPPPVRWDLRAMTESPRAVLVGIDGTPSGLEALALGSAFAVLTGSPLLLAAVYGYQGGSFAGGLAWPPRADADRWLDEASQQLSDFIPWTMETALSTSPAHGLVEPAERAHARLIVLGSNRHGPLGHVLAGSTARRVAHGAPCAVAIAPHDWRTQPPEVPLTFGVGVNDAPEARDALALVASFAETANAPLKLFTAVHVASPVHPMYAATGTTTSTGAANASKKAGASPARPWPRSARPSRPTSSCSRAIRSNASRALRAISTCSWSVRGGSARSGARCSAASRRR
jgi:nucleotide-binding universal stress UspA family protein